MVGLLALVLLSYGGVLIFLVASGLLDIDARSSDAKVIAAVLALVGGLFASSLTLAGAVLNFSLARRDLQLRQATDARLKADQDRERARLAADSAATNKRLQVEAATQAVALLTLSDGRPAPSAQQSGALFILTGLGQYELALALLREMWTHDGVSATAATWILDRILRDPEGGLIAGNELGPADQTTRINLQIDAGQVLAVKTEMLLNGIPELGFVFPPCAIGEWPMSAHPWARTSVLAAFLGCMRMRAKDEWDPVGLLESFRAQLMLIRDQETDEFIRGAATLAISVIDGETTSAAARSACGSELGFAIEALEAAWANDGPDRDPVRHASEIPVSSIGPALPRLIDGESA